MTKARIQYYNHSILDIKEIEYYQSFCSTTVGFINIHRIWEIRLRNKGGKFLNFLEAKAKMEPQAIIESVTHACMYAQLYFLFNNQECAPLVSILLHVFQSMKVWKVHFSKFITSKFQFTFHQWELLPQVLEVGRVAESLGPL